MTRKASLLALLVFFLLSSTLFSATTQVPQTGQTKCYDVSGAEMPCGGTGQDGEFKAGAAWPSPRFMVAGDCVTDNLTGLMWTRDANPPGGCTYWSEALVYLKGVNTCGYLDWRLPNVNELESLTNHEYGYGDEETEGLAEWLTKQGFINV